MYLWGKIKRLKLSNNNNAQINVQSSFVENSKSKKQCKNFLIEEEPSNLRIGVSIQKLTKIYDNSKLAVDNLTINFYENQMLANNF